MHIYHKHLLERLKFTEINEIYWAMGLKTMAISFVGIFIPIYFYKLGFSISTIFFYYAVAYLVKAILDDVFARVVIRIGPKHGFVLSFPLLLLYLWMVMTLPQYNWNIWFLAVVSGFSNSLSWISYHIDFSKAKHKKTTSLELSRMQALMTVSGAVAPFIGGLLATQYNISLSFTIAMLFLVLASFPLFKTGEPHIARKLNMKKIDTKKIRKDLIGAFGVGQHFANLYEVWPLFIFLIVGTYESVGSLESLSLLIAVFTTLYIGRKVKSTNRHKILERGGLIEGILWFLRSFTQTIFHVLSFNILHAFVSPLVRIPYFSEMYMHTDEESRVEYILWMERAIDFGRTFMFLSLALMSLIFSIKAAFIISFVLAGIGALMTSSIRPAKDEV